MKTFQKSSYCVSLLFLCFIRKEQATFAATVGTHRKLDS